MNRFLQILLIFIAAYLQPAISAAATEDVCDCIKIKIGAQDTIAKNAYLTYKFTLKNTCTLPVWINTSYFGFNIYDYNGKAIPKLRDLKFVRRYSYPEFVLIDPKAEYEFKFSDDPFMEYKLERHTKYMLAMKYNNTKAKHSTKKNLNYLCNREMKRLIYVK